ncbi:hypothetical protein AAHC03_020728 [Spirometra sp. Aus1]
MSLNYVHFEYRNDEDTPKVQEIVNRYIAEKKLLTERPREVSEYQPLTKILVSVDSEFADAFTDEIKTIQFAAVKKHA